jgi:hypothetical protein
MPTCYVRLVWQAGAVHGSDAAASWGLPGRRPPGAVRRRRGTERAGWQLLRGGARGRAVPLVHGQLQLGGRRRGGGGALPTLRGGGLEAAGRGGGGARGAAVY